MNEMAAAFFALVVRYLDIVHAPSKHCMDQEFSCVFCFFFLHGFEVTGIRLIPISFGITSTLGAFWKPFLEGKDKGDDYIAARQNQPRTR